MKTLIEVLHEPILILNERLFVITANDTFYKTFQLEPKHTENTLIYKIGNNQWNIPALKKLLENIIPKNKFFKGFEINHRFTTLGQKNLILSVRQIYTNVDNCLLPIIFISIDDITEMIAIGESLAGHTKQMESKLSERTDRISSHIKKLEKEITSLKKPVKYKENL